MIGFQARVKNHQLICMIHSNFQQVVIFCVFFYYLLDSNHKSDVDLLDLKSEKSWWH